MKPRVVRLKANMVGKSVPSNINGAAGRYIEKELGEQGYPMSNRAGPDIPEIEMEVKSRDLDATSAQTIARMTPEDIKLTPYRKSVVHDKLQRQYLVKTKDQVIVSTESMIFQNRIYKKKSNNAMRLPDKKLSMVTRVIIYPAAPMGFLSGRPTDPGHISSDLLMVP